jgi:hypothetical protein
MPVILYLREQWVSAASAFLSPVAARRFRRRAGYGLAAVESASAGQLAGRCSPLGI